MAAIDNGNPPLTTNHSPAPFNWSPHPQSRRKATWCFLFYFLFSSSTRMAITNQVTISNWSKYHQPSSNYATMALIPPSLDSTITANATISLVLPLLHVNVDALRASIRKMYLLETSPPSCSNFVASQWQQQLTQYYNQPQKPSSALQNPQAPTMQQPPWCLPALAYWVELHNSMASWHPGPPTLNDNLQTDHHQPTKPLPTIQTTKTKTMPMPMPMTAMTRMPMPMTPKNNLQQANPGTPHTHNCSNARPFLKITTTI